MSLLHLDDYTQQTIALSPPLLPAHRHTQKKQRNYEPSNIIITQGGPIGHIGKHFLNTKTFRLIARDLSICPTLKHHALCFPIKNFLVSDLNDL